MGGVGGGRSLRQTARGTAACGWSALAASPEILGWDELAVAGGELRRHERLVFAARTFRMRRAAVGPFSSAAGAVVLLLLSAAILFACKYSRRRACRAISLSSGRFSARDVPTARGRSVRRAEPRDRPPRWVAQEAGGDLARSLWRSKGAVALGQALCRGGVWVVGWVKVLRRPLLLARRPCKRAGG